LSLAQAQMWRLVTTAQPPGLQNITALHRFAGRPDEAALRAALAHLVERHEALRMGIAVAGGEPSQFVAGTAAVDLTVTKVDGDLHEKVAEHNAAPFDLARPPLFRVGLFHPASAESVLVVTIDHVVCDGTGIAVLVHELMAVYEALLAGRRPKLPVLPVPFADFAVWQRAHVTEEVLAGQLRWWAGALEGAPLGPAVPFDHVPSTPKRRIIARSYAVPAPVRSGLDRVARATGGTVFTVVAAAVGAVLGRVGGTTDVVMSTTTSGRNRAEVEGLVGMFSGISRIRTDLSGDPPFVAVVERSRDWIVGMFENSDIPFMRVRRTIMSDFPTDGPAVAAALPVEFQYFHTRPETDVELFFRGQLHPLSITLLDDGTAISGELSYKLDFYEPATVDALAGALEAMFAAVASDPSRRLSDLSVSR
jgi:non-ribosomal peptide synthetase component F